MPELEAISAVRTLPRNLRRQSDSPVCPSILRNVADRVTRLVDARAAQHNISFGHRNLIHTDVEFGAMLPTDLLTLIVDTLDPPYCLPEIANLMFDGRVHVIQVVSATPIPQQADWFTHIHGTELGLLGGRQLQSGVLVPPSPDRQPELLECIRLQDIQNYSGADAANAIGKAAEMRHRFGRIL